MNPDAITIINPWKEYWPSWRFKPGTLIVEQVCAISEVQLKLKHY